ncbi:hypothetical protein CJ260_11895 [Megasphaera sp. ASD88]|uniref:hypothetical protein n=1 Tax=Megasphaera sp. ASD88 TaxID=2027407 RepID=UPI000BAC0E13|nr:hypothetical protein [Megasphaera sp. ASD88]PAV37964.1 hypothetical protein CJ260_11895 [Megasphaera sp. ASD88]
MMKTQETITTTAITCPAGYVPREEYDELKRRIHLMQHDTATVLIQRHMYKLAASQQYGALRGTRDALISRAANTDTELLDCVIAQIITLVANYFYRAGLVDSFECAGTVADIYDLIGLDEIPLEQVANEHHAILDEGISRASIDAIAE